MVAFCRSGIGHNILVHDPREHFIRFYMLFFMVPFDYSTKAINVIRAMNDTNGINAGGKALFFGV